MSELQRSFAKAHLTRLAPEPGLTFDEADEEADVEDQDAVEPPLPSPSGSSSSASSASTIVPSASKNLFDRAKAWVKTSPLIVY